MLIENVQAVYKRIACAALKSERNPEEIRLIAVTKGVDRDIISEAIEIGLRDFGENRVQSALQKVPELKGSFRKSNVSWHLIGHLQRNKAKVAVELFDVIHSLDSLELAEYIDKQAGRIGKIQRVLIQVKLSHEESKHGIDKESLPDLLKGLTGLGNLHAEGLMTIPPYFNDPEKSRPYFRELRELRDYAEKSGFGLRELSMGMSNDFEVAIEEGATMVRVGTAIFGDRRMEVK